MSEAEAESVEITSDMIRLGQLLKFVDVAESGAQAAAIIASGDVLVDGEPESRRGRQLQRGAVVEIRLPAGTRRLRVV